MARLRKWVSYRRLERPYTRTSKFRKKAYVRGLPNCKIVRFDMGNVKRDYGFALHLVSKEGLQIRQEAIESARLTSNRLLEKKVGKQNFHFRIRMYPHHILRENPLAAGAGADRFSTGMSHSFGKVMGIAAQIKKGQEMMTLKVNEEHLKFGRAALRRASHKLPCRAMVVEERIASTG